jgi:ABC-2 type transport system ATP-binding protein
VGSPEAAARSLERCPEVAAVTVRDGEVVVAIADGVVDRSPIAARLVADGHGLVSLREQEVNLETAFLELTRGSLARPADG